MNSFEFAFHYCFIVEQELLRSLPVREQCTLEESQVLLTLYESKLKKYHVLSTSENNRISFGESLFVQHNKLRVIVSNITESSPPHTPNAVVNSISVSTPNVTKVYNNNVNKIDGKKNRHDDSQQMHVDYLENFILSKLKKNLDVQVYEAEWLYYNCEYYQCSQLTEAILKEDPYHDGCLPIYISCQVQLRQSNSNYLSIQIIYG